MDLFLLAPPLPVHPAGGKPHQQHRLRPRVMHCKKLDPFAALPTEPIAFPLRHPTRVEHCRAADEAFFARREKKRRRLSEIRL